MIRKFLKTAVVVLVVAICVQASAEITLRFTHATTGGPDKAALDGAVASFEKANPGVTVKQLPMDDDVYEDMGLLSLFTAGNPPDVYYQWGGWLVGEYVRKGRALDLTAALDEDGWRDTFFPNVWDGATYNGKIYMIPTDISLTTLHWYSESAFKQCGLKAPEDWAGFLDCCEKIKARGLVPLSFGNAELWPAANWAAHLISRIAGEDVYERVLSLEKGTTFLHPDFVKGLSMIKEMADKGYFNRGLNGANDTEGQMLFFNGICAMHPIGSWLIAAAQESAPKDFSYDAFNLPAIPGGKGDQTSVIALSTGYMISGATKHPKESIALLKHITTVEVQQEFVKAGTYSSVKGSISAEWAPPQLQRAMEIYTRSGKEISAPDVGFDLDVADAFLQAVALVMDGKMNARAALRQCESKVRGKRK